MQPNFSPEIDNQQMKLAPDREIMWQKCDFEKITFKEGVHYNRLWFVLFCPM